MSYLRSKLPPGKWDKCDDDLIAALVECIPVEGGKVHTTIHNTQWKGDEVSEHRHRLEWVALYYVDLGDPPCALIVEGERLDLEPGDVIVLPPGTLHAIERCESERPRISLGITYLDTRGIQGVKANETQ